MPVRSAIRSLGALLLVLLFAATSAAEYCKTQGSPRVPKSEIEPYDRRALLSKDEILDAEEKYLRWGRPECPRILFHKEYVLCYDLPRRVAKWAIYRLEAKDVVPGERLNAFRSDPRLPEDQNPACDDYRGSGYDRGHLVPRSDMNRSRYAVVNTFFLTNMSPQLPNVNQGAWARLEDLVRLWAKRYGAVHVISGTIFDDDDDRRPDPVSWAEPTKEGADVRVPSHFYKIILREQGGELPVNPGEALREGVARERRDDAAGNQLVAASVRLHAAVTGARGAGVDAEDSHASEASISFSSMSKFAHTCCTSS